MMLEPQRAGIPVPAVTPFTRPFWDAAKEGRLLYQFFPASGRAQFNPAPIDRVSLSEEFEWRQSAGRGAVYSHSTVWRPQTPAFRTPYAAAIVELEEGYHMISNIVGCDPGDVHVGLRVIVQFERIGDEFVLPYFTPEEDR